MNKNLFLQYCKAFLFSLILFAVVFVYASYYYGYVSLNLINKITADTAIMLLGLVLLIGPLTRAFDIFDHYILYRKELGVVAFFYALFHGFLSILALPLTYYAAHLSTFIPGISSFLILLILYVLTFEHVIAHINRNKWWHIQNWGVRIGALLGLIHFTLMKYGGWIAWYAHGGTAAVLHSYLPSTGLLAASFGLFVLLVRLTDFLISKKQSTAVILLSLFYIMYLGVTFGWGSTFKNTIPPLTWQICISQRDNAIRETFPSTCMMPDGRTVTQIVRE